MLGVPAEPAAETFGVVAAGVETFGVEEVGVEFDAAVSVPAMLSSTTTGVEPFGLEFDAAAGVPTITTGIEPFGSGELCPTAGVGLDPLEVPEGRLRMTTGSGDETVSGFDVTGVAFPAD